MLKLALLQVSLVIGGTLSVPSVPENSGIQSRLVNSALSERSASDTPQVHNNMGYAFEKTATLVYEVLNRVANHRLTNFLMNHDFPQLGMGASGDPASLGVAVLVAAATSNKERSKYFQRLADDQLDWLLHHVPINENGAISQRDKELQYWSDYVYMAPPFLAYYGATTCNATILEIAYNQAKQYRTILQDGKIKVWEHIVDGSFEDRKYWSTGNGWAAAGMMRLYSTFLNLRDTKLRELTEPWREDLAAWVTEIVKGAYVYQNKDSHLLPNYLANTNTSHNYPECSGTALIAAAAYRLASLRPTCAKDLPLDAINAARVAIFTKYTNQQTGAVAPVVDPLDWNAVRPFNGTKPIVGYVSPEGQAFTLLLFEAWKAYISTLNCNASGHPHCPTDTPIAVGQ